MYDVARYGETVGEGLDLVREFEQSDGDEGMNRKAFFTSLLGTIGVARAQQSMEAVPMTTSGDGWVRRKRHNLNNHCPVCGTTADPYVRAKGFSSWRTCTPSENPTGINNVACLESDGKPYGPMERITRCKRCNAAFWQDAKE